MHATMHSAMLNIGQALFATGAILAAELPHGDLGDWMQMVERLGLAVALVVFFVMTGWKREQRMASRLDKLERDNDKLATRTATLAEQVTQTQAHTNRIIDEALKTLDGRMCWACTSREEFEKMREVVANMRKVKQ